MSTPQEIKLWATQYAGKIVEVDIVSLPYGASKLCFVLGYAGTSVVVRPSQNGWRALDEVGVTWVAPVFTDTYGWHISLDWLIGKYPLDVSPIMRKDKSGILHYPTKCPRCNAAAAIMFNTIDCSAKCH